MKRFAKRRSIGVSADDFICGAADNVSPFPQSGPIVEDCLERILTYSCARMGRRTYEFGWAHVSLAGPMGFRPAPFTYAAAAISPTGFCPTVA